MEIWIISKNGVPINTVYGALSTACKEAGVSYKSAAVGKRVWIVSDEVVLLTQATVQKRKNRGSQDGLRKFTKNQ